MGIYIPNITLKDIKEHPSRFLIGSKGVTLEVTDVYGNALSENAVQEIAPHGRLLDENELLERCAIRGITKCIETVIEAER